AVVADERLAERFDDRTIFCGFVGGCLDAGGRRFVDGGFVCGAGSEGEQCCGGDGEDGAHGGAFRGDVRILISVGTDRLASVQTPGPPRSRHIERACEVLCPHFAHILRPSLPLRTPPARTTPQLETFSRRSKTRRNRFLPRWSGVRILSGAHSSRGAHSPLLAFALAQRTYAATQPPATGCAGADARVGDI